MNGIITYLKDTRAEIDHIMWPSQRQTLIYTALVILLSVVIGSYLGVLDVFLARGLDYVLAR